MTSYQFHLFKVALPVSIILFFTLSTSIIWTFWAPSLGPLAENRDAIFSAVIKAMERDLSAARTYSAWLHTHQLIFLWMAHVALPTLLSLFSSVCFVVWYVSQSEVRHLAGPLPLEGSAAIRHARSMHKKELSDGKSENGLRIHRKIYIAQKRETGNLLVTGVAGGGKSVIEKPIAAQIVTRGDRALIYDQKSEYLPLFYNPENAIIISPPDSRSKIWDIADDCQNEEDARMIAENFLPMAADVKDPVWINGARTILAGCIISLQNENENLWGWHELRMALAQPDKTLHEFLLPHAPEAAELIDPSGNSQTTRGYRSNILSALNWLPTVARAWLNADEKPFSIRRWLADPNSPRVIIVPNNPEFSAVSAPLCAALISLLVTRTLSLPDSNDRRIWLILDELANLPKIPSILKWLELGRSKGARMLAGFQSYSQIQEIYGDKSAQTLLSLFHSVVSMRCGQAGGTAEIVSRAFGQRQVKRLSLTDSGDGKASTNWQAVDEPVVRPEALQHLPQPNKKGVVGYLSIAGWNAVYRLTWPYNTPKKIAAEFVEADWVRRVKKQKIASELVDSRTVRTVREAHGSTINASRATNNKQKISAAAISSNRAQQTAAPQSKINRRNEK